MEEEKSIAFDNNQLNEFQTPITKELLEQYPKEVQEQFWEFVLSVPFIKNLISAKRQRAKDRPRDDKGRIIVDLANPHILEDMDYFRQAAIKFEKDGRYTDLKPNSNPNSPYGKWVRREIRRCWEGMVRPSDGEWVTGYLYFYLNYFPMMVTKADKDEKKKRAARTEGFPEVWEATYWRFHCIDQARNGGFYNNFEGGEHVAELSKRGSGKSFSLADIMGHNLIFGENEDAHKRTTTILTAYLKEYLADKDGTLSKFIPLKSFLAEHTQFPRRMLIDSPHKMTWKSGYKDKLTGAETGTLNNVLALSSKDDVAKIRGKRGYILFEEFGSFPNLIDIYNNVRDGMKEGKYVYGFAYLVGTAGDKDSDFHGAQELLYNPKGYDIYAIPNVWDKPNQGRPWFAFFTPAYVNLKGFYNENGVSDVIAGLLFLLMNRYKAKYETGDPKTIIKVVSNMPITPSEAIIQGGISQFPVVDIENRILEINSNPNFYDDTLVGQLVITDNKVEFVPTSDTPIRFYQQKDNKNMPGAIEIFEKPQTDSNGEVYANRYIAGADPYDNDESTTTSLGSILILDLMTDRIVAEYTGRPPMADDYFEICRRLCLYYNARVNYEAHPYSQKVYTPDGLRIWKDIKVGDRLFAPNGKVVTVKDIPVDEYMPIYKVTLADGRVVEVSDNHIWNVYQLNHHVKDTVNITTKEMLEYGVKNKFGQNSFFIPNGGSVEYEHREVSIDPYTLGLLLAEGAFTKFVAEKKHNKIRNTVQFSSSKEDAEFYAKNLPYHIKYIGKKGCSWHLYKINIESDLRNLGLIGHSSYTKFIPEEYLFNDYNTRLELLKGLMDGDGCACKTGAPIFITTSEKLRDDFMLLCRSLGMNCSYTTRKAFTKEGINAHEAYRIVIYTEKILFKLPRKIDNQHIYNPTARGSKANAYINKTAIVSIEYDHDERGRCVTVDSEDGLYLVGDYVVTHNCNKKGLFAHFSRMNSTYLLTDVLEILIDKQMNKPGGVGNTAKGTNATQAVNGWGRQLIAKYLLTPQTIVIAEEEEEKEVKRRNLDFIKNKALLIELSQWNPFGNFDRVSAMGMLMLLREDKLRLMGGQYNGKDEDWNDPDDPANDEFWSNNFHDEDGDEMSMMMYKKEKGY